MISGRRSAYLKTRITDLLDGLIRGEGDAQDGPQHFAKLNDLADRAADNVHWDGKADPAIGT